MCCPELGVRKPTCVTARKGSFNKRSRHNQGETKAGRIFKHKKIVFRNGSKLQDDQTHACTHMHICVHAHTHTCTHTCMHAHTHACAHNAHICLHAHARTCMHAHTCVHRHMFHSLGNKYIFSGIPFRDNWMEAPSPENTSHSGRCTRAGIL